MFPGFFVREYIRESASGQFNSVAARASKEKHLSLTGWTKNCSQKLTLRDGLLTEVAAVDAVTEGGPVNVGLVPGRVGPRQP